MLEKRIQDSILKYLRKNYPRAIVWKLHENQFFGVSGIPDIFFAHQGFTAFFEVKAPGGRPSGIQIVQMNLLNWNKVKVYLVESVDEVRKIMEEK